MHWSFYCCNKTRSAVTMSGRGQPRHANTALTIDYTMWSLIDIGKQVLDTIKNYNKAIILGYFNESRSQRIRSIK